MAEDGDLEVLGAARTDGEPDERGDEAVENSLHEASTSASVSPKPTPTTGYSTPTPSDQQ